MPLTAERARALHSSLGALLADAPALNSGQSIDWNALQWLGCNDPAGPAMRYVRTLPSTHWVALVRTWRRLSICIDTANGGFQVEAAA